MVLLAVDLEIGWIKAMVASKTDKLVFQKFWGRQFWALEGNPCPPPLSLSLSLCLSSPLHSFPHLIPWWAQSSWGHKTKWAAQGAEQSWKSGEKWRRQAWRLTLHQFVDPQSRVLESPCCISHWELVFVTSAKASQLLPPVTIPSRELSEKYMWSSRTCQVVFHKLSKYCPPRNIV